MWYHGGIHASFSTPTHPSVLPPAYSDTCISSHPPDHPPAHQHSPTQVVGGLPYFRRSVLPSAQPAGCPSANLSAYSPVVHRFVRPFIHLPSRPAARPPTYLPTHQLPACPYVCSSAPSTGRPPPVRQPIFLLTSRPPTRTSVHPPTYQTRPPVRQPICLLTSRPPV